MLSPRLQVDFEEFPWQGLNCSCIEKIHIISAKASGFLKFRLKRPRPVGFSQQKAPFRHVAKGGSEGADEPPFFSDQKKKVDGVRVWQLRVPGAIAPACTVVGLRIHGPEPNLESVAAVDLRQTLGIPSNVHYQHPLWFSALIGKACA